MRSNFEIVMRWLEEGNEIVLDGNTYALGETNDIVIKLEMYSYNGQDGTSTKKSENWHLTNMSFKHFYDLCEKLTEADRIAIVSNNVLQTMKGKQ